MLGERISYIVLGCHHWRYGCRHWHPDSSIAFGRGRRVGHVRSPDRRPPCCRFQRRSRSDLDRLRIGGTFFGAVIAGRFSHSLHGGFVHGIMVWCLTLIITLILVSMGTSMVMGGALKVLGASVGIGGKAVVSGVGDVVKDGAKRSSDQIQSFIQEAVQSISTNAAPKATTRASREIGFAVTKLFAHGTTLTHKPIGPLR